MDNEFVVRLIDKVLESWEKLDDKHKGSLYQDVVDHLVAWREKLSHSSSN